MIWDKTVGHSPSMPPQRGPYNVPEKMEGDNISMESDEEGFVVLGLDESDSGQEEEEGSQVANPLAGYVPLNSNEDTALVTGEQAQVLRQSSADSGSADDECYDVRESWSTQEQEETSQVNVGVATTSSEHGVVSQPEASASCSSYYSMTSEHVDLVKQAMASFTLPSSSIPDWAKEIPEERWKESLFLSINKRDQQNK